MRKKSSYLIKSIFMILFISLFCQVLMAQQRHALLKSIFQELKNNSIYKNKINWSNMDQYLNTDLDQKRNPTDFLLSAVQKVLTELGDKHAFFQYNDTVIRGKFTESKRAIDSSIYQYALEESYAFRTAVIDDQYGYIAMPSARVENDFFSDKSKMTQRIKQMAQQLQDSLCSLSEPRFGGLIIDLRLNRGGTLWIHLGALTPLLKDGTLFTMQYADGSNTKFSRLGNTIYQDRDTMVTTRAHCDFDNKKVVVLVGALTGSAGEQTALALKSNLHTMVIGEETAGYLSMNETKVFEENAILSYSKGILKDNQAKSYPHSLYPDLRVIGGDNFKNLANDAKIKAAITQLKK